MARNKTQKITVSFENPELIKRLVGDTAMLENKSASAIIERTVLQSLLPKNNEAKAIVTNFLYSENGGIGKTLAAEFENNASGTNWDAVHDNLLPLVHFAKTQEFFCNTTLTGKEKELYHMASQVQFIIDKLNQISEETDDLTKQSYYKREAIFGSHLLEELKEEPGFSRLINFYQLLLNNWDHLKNWTITYRLLSDLAKIEKGWRDTPETRMELLQIIKNVSSEW